MQTVRDPANSRARLSRTRSYRLAAALIFVVLTATLVVQWWGWLEPRHASALRRSEDNAADFDPRRQRLGVLTQVQVPVAAAFGWPLGNARGALVYDAQSFGSGGHLGADLNGIGGWDSDRGDTVFAAGDGLVVRAGNAGGKWGGLVILAHRLADGVMVQTLYGHLDRIDVSPGQVVGRGEGLGSVGDGDKSWLPHLHFEVRRGVWLDEGTGYGEDPKGREDPVAFLQRHAPGLSGWLPAPGIVEAETQSAPPVKVETEK
ncbi:MAG TPA: M23 family metallopeptidase [Verrucomicrobiales bacterium]|nr:M23 family metallopeptidase [Verrucomicrobiales bacterium]